MAVYGESTNHPAPVTIYCDQNCLITIKERSRSYHEQVYEALGRTVQFVFSPWHWVEIARNTDPIRLFELAGFATSLQPWWLMERRALQREEVHGVFYAFAGIPVPSPSPFRSFAEVAGNLLGRPLPNGGYTLVEFAAGFAHNPGPVLQAHQQNRNARAQNLKDWHKAKADSALMRNINQRTLGPLLPTHTPAGLLIAPTLHAAFLDAVDVQDLPALATEFALLDDAINRGAALRFQSFSDDQHATVALPRVTIFLTNDQSLTKTIKRIRTTLSFPIATVATMDYLDELISSAPPPGRWLHTDA